MKKFLRALELMLVISLLAACRPLPAATLPPATMPPTAVPATWTPAPTQGLVTPAASPTVEAAAGPATALPVGALSGLPAGSEGYPWWNDTTFYEIFVRSFYDSNGDGIGDFNGIAQKLDYLSDLGITGLWLMPIYPSPTYHGYDVTDYQAVNPDYGTLDDFKNLLKAAHTHHIRVILDLPLNHTSNQHPWFKAAQDPKSPYRDWYLWSDSKPKQLGPWGEVVWHPGKSGYYYGVFTAEMPDLNYNNPEVVTAMQEVGRFWLRDVGVDGFRLDGARYVVEEPRVLADSASNHAFFKELRKFNKGLNPQAMTVGEVWTNNYAVSTYTDGDQLDLAFNFDLATAFISSATTGEAARARDQLTMDLQAFKPNTFAPFLTNHDMPRTLSQVGRDLEKARNAAALLLTSPGAPFIYYGEEIGMSGAKPDELIRTPMQWSGAANAGFTSGRPWEPVNSDAATVNVAAQAGRADSLLGFYKSLIQIRNQHVALRVGQALPVTSKSGQVYALLRNSAQEQVLVILNLGKTAVGDYALSLSDSPLRGSYRAAALFGAGPYADLSVSAQGGFDGYLPAPSLPANSLILIQLQAVK